jgi:hypothetical protein
MNAFNKTWVYFVNPFLESLRELLLNDLILYGPKYSMVTTSFFFESPISKFQLNTVILIRTYPCNEYGRIVLAIGL